jgi:HEXXH motif-containing protein
LVTGREGFDGPVIGGASTFSLWGALFLNVDQLHDRLTAAVALAHEVAHSYLLGLTRGRPLVENDDGERYPSPLRRDPRPMDGIAHATYVLARMIYALRSLVGSGRLDARELVEARNQLQQKRAAYDRGLATVRAHARFTPAGAAAFAQLQLYMGRG